MWMFSYVLFFLLLFLCFVYLSFYSDVSKYDFIPGSFIIGLVILALLKLPYCQHEFFIKPKLKQNTFYSYSRIIRNIFIFKHVLYKTVCHIFSIIFYIFIFYDLLSYFKLKENICILLNYTVKIYSWVN